MRLNGMKKSFDNVEGAKKHLNELKKKRLVNTVVHRMNLNIM